MDKKSLFTDSAGSLHRDIAVSIFLSHVGDRLAVTGPYRSGLGYRIRRHSGPDATFKIEHGNVGVPGLCVDDGDRCLFAIWRKIPVGEIRARFADIAQRFSISAEPRVLVQRPRRWSCGSIDKHTIVGNRE